ncbi:MAG TPA: hypothetical protein VKT73_12925 [Xanthobacteraceae bacterium]|nr:hypothetical protein [Xanthobacteraceae bacterium]
MVKRLKLKKAKAKKRSTHPRTQAEMTAAYDARKNHGAITDNTPVAPIEIVDPHGTNPGDKIVTFRSLRSDPIASIHARGSITDIQYDAARRYQRLYELTQIGMVQAIDPAKPAVDGGRFSDGNTDARMRAADTLAAINKELGWSAAWLFDILVAEMTLRDACAKRGMFSKQEQIGATLILTEALSSVAVELGLMTAPDVPVIPPDASEKPQAPKTPAKQVVSAERMHPFHP